MASSSVGIDSSDNKTTLTEFIESLYSKITKKKRKADGDPERDVILSISVKKCQALQDGICKCEVLNHNNVVEYLQSLAKLVLDVTYVDECSLVKDDFPPERSWSTINYIMDEFEQLEKLVNRCCPGEKIMTSLGAEIVECLHWRRGALCYMYSHTLNNAEPAASFPSHYRQCLETGVRHLVAMLGCRSSLAWLYQNSRTQSVGGNNPGVLSNDTNTQQLYTEGVLSDTHMLALVYCGELGYWHAQALDQALFDQSGDNTDQSNSPDFTNLTLSSLLQKIEDDGLQVEAKSDFDEATSGSPESSNQSNSFEESIVPQVYAYLANLCLKKYVDIAKGPLSIADWNTTQAELMLKYLSKKEHTVSFSITSR